ncbi:MAG TPA: proline iminopeptidase-family hydrolase [Anaerolineales bacterium]|nr:proline iminopeptidase-family hydrolase [Anaerolineales bacterium]
MAILTLVGRTHHSSKHPSGTFGTQRDHPAKSRERRASGQLDRLLSGRALSAYGMLPRQRAMHIQEGTIPFRGYHTWYRVVGEQDQLGRAPVLCLHGGPGSGHFYLEPLEALAEDGRQVIFYDQLGCGNSDVPEDLSLHTVDLYVDEVDAVRLALGLESVHILGHSWGGMLAMQYALTQPHGLRSLILSNTGASMPQWMAEDAILLAQLPEKVQQTLKNHESAGTTDSDEYKLAGAEFYRRHASLRVQPRPECLKRMQGKPGEHIYKYMWGPGEWIISGTLANWDITSQLGEIHVPTLVLVGRHDHATPALSQTIRDGIPGAEMFVFEKSGHHAHLEETPLYLQHVKDFLRDVER